jgi:hypothetical protein
MQATLENRKKTITKFPKNVLKRKSKIEEGGTLRLRVEKK